MPSFSPTEPFTHGYLHQAREYFGADALHPISWIAETAHSETPVYANFPAAINFESRPMYLACLAMGAGARWARDFITPKLSTETPHQFTPSELLDMGTSTPTLFACQIDRLFPRHLALSYIYGFLCGATCTAPHMEPTDLPSFMSPPIFPNLYPMYKDLILDSITITKGWQRSQSASKSLLAQHASTRSSQSDIDLWSLGTDHLNSMSDVDMSKSIFALFSQYKGDFYSVHEALVLSHAIAKTARPLLTPQHKNSI